MVTSVTGQTTLLDLVKVTDQVYATTRYNEYCLLSENLFIGSSY
jgi:hypothetical protein